MPENCWSYLLASALGGIVGFAWYTWLTSHAPGKNWFGRTSQTGVLWLLTTGGSVLLHRWQGLAVGAVVGCSWTISFAAGVAIAHWRLVRIIYQSVGNDPADKSALLGEIEVQLRKLGFDAASNKARSYAKKLTSKRRKHTEQQLQATMRELNSTTRKCKELTARLAEAESRHASLKQSVSIFTSVLSTASRELEQHGDPWPPTDLLQLIVDNIAKILGGSDEARVSLFIFATSDQAWPLVNTRGSRTTSRHSGNPIQRTRSLAGAAMHFGQIICWPEDGEADPRIRSWYEARASSSAWPRFVVIPIPFRSESGASSGMSARHGALCIELKADNPHWNDSSEVVLAYAALIDPVCSMSRYNIEALARNAESRWRGKRTL